MQPIACVESESLFSGSFRVDMLRDKRLLRLNGQVNSDVVYRMLDGKDYQRAICCFHLLGHFWTGLLDYEGWSTDDIAHLALYASFQNIKDTL